MGEKQDRFRAHIFLRFKIGAYFLKKSIRNTYLLVLRTVLYIVLRFSGQQYQ